VKARGRKGGALGFRSEPRGELFVLLAGGARTAPVVNAAVTARVAWNVVLLAEVGADVTATDQGAKVSQSRERAEGEDCDALDGAAKDRVQAAESSGTVTHLDDLSRLDHLLVSTWSR